MDDEKITRLREIVSGSGSIVFFGGAGVSTESGIPDFRSPAGLYAAGAPAGQKGWTHPPEEMLSHDFFFSHTEEFYSFYRSRVLALGAAPNPAHLALARWEAEGWLKAVVTQNIDGLHQKAGSQKVLELHGSVHRNTCLECGRAFGAEAVARAPGVPRCPCGGLIKPDVVLYGEGLDETVLAAAVRAIARADTLIIGGTSLAVWPAAGLVDYFTGTQLVVINKGETGRELGAGLMIDGPIGQVLGAT